MGACSPLQTIRPPRPRQRPKTQPTASPSGRRATAYIRVGRHLYRERFGHLGHDNARHRNLLRLRAAVYSWLCTRKTTYLGSAFPSRVCFWNARLNFESTILHYRELVLHLSHQLHHLVPDYPIVNCSVFGACNNEGAPIETMKASCMR